MPEESIEIAVSRREADRPRLLQLTAFDGSGALEGLDVSVEVDANGSFADDAEVREIRVVTPAGGAAILQWFEWPRHGPARDFTSTVRAVWQRADASVYIENLYE